MSVSSNILKNAGASIWVKVSIIIFRLIQVPLLLSALGTEDFGRWLVIFSLPSWLLFANMGFGSVAANEMSMSVASGDIKNARGVFSTSIAFIALIGVAGSLLVTLILPWVPLESFLKLPEQKHAEVTMAAIWLSITVFISFFSEIFYGRFRAARKAYMSTMIYSILPWLDLLAIFITLKLSTRFDHLALGLLCSNLIYILVAQWASRRAMPSLYFSISLIDVKKFKPLFAKGLAFLAFPLGNALLFQGNLLIVQVVLGPVAVALFGTARTLVRTVNQAMELINQVIWPEFSHLIGADDLKGAAKLHRGGVAVSIIASFCGVLALAIWGPELYSLWVGKSIVLPYHILLIFLLPILFNALWFTSSVVHVACNQHEGLAMRYLFATCLSALCCVALSYTIGIAGAALSTLVVDLLLIPYVLKRSLVLTDDSWKEFFYGMLQEVRTLPDFLKRKLNRAGKI